ncbi:MAG: glycosyltransferase family 4 protein [Chthoniobacterales bacterium]
MNSQKISVHFMPGDGKGWALDEDRRQMREALKGIICETTLMRAQVLHTPFWQGLNSVAPEILKQAFIIAHADNPPFFYLKQPEFFLGQQQVDLWIARSLEALEQFHSLRLPVKYIPYTIDPELFFPIADKKALRERFNIPLDRYVIANFHRDTEGADLVTPKLQKAPELLLAILKKLQTRGANIHVLLAGPRRHWLRKELMREGIPFTFVGKSDIEGDDFGINILNRVTLNELTNAADLYLIPSRWEGGPQSAMEAAACRCKLMSTPLGVARDILEPASLFHSTEEAVKKIFEDIQCNSLQSTLEPQWKRWKKSHTTESLFHGLCELYRELPSDVLFQRKVVAKNRSLGKAPWQQVTHILKTRLGYQSLPKKIGWNHAPGKNRDLDAVMLAVGQAFKALGISICRPSGVGLECIGWPTEKLPPARSGCVRLQWIVPGMPIEIFFQADLFITPSVQDILNLRSEGFGQPAIVIPFPIAREKNKEASPFVVPFDDKHASMNIWRALAEGRSVVYPEHLAYYEQVFHGGLPYKNEPDLPGVLASARQSNLELSMLARIPVMNVATKSLKKLLAEINFS